MIPPIFARAAEREIIVLGICADYLEDHGKDGSILRNMMYNHFLLDESGYCSNSGFKFFDPGSGSGSVYGNYYGGGFGYGKSNNSIYIYDDNRTNDYSNIIYPVYGDSRGNGYGIGYGDLTGDGGLFIGFI